MALLDDLKQEAERIRRDGVSPKTKQDLQQVFYETQIKPTLKRIYVYLNELREQLNVIKLDISSRYNIPGIGTTDTLAKDYVVQIDSSSQVTQVGFRCTAAALELQRGTIGDDKTAEDLRNLLNSMKHSFTEFPVKGFSGSTVGIRFEFMLNIPISVLFIADTPNQSIQMISTNFEGFKTWQHRVKPDKIDDMWLDKLGLYLVRRGPDPNTLTLSNEEREKIQRHLRSTRERFRD
jgi:hypothetical protein